eukprot:gene6148-7658_t
MSLLIDQHIVDPNNGDNNNIQQHHPIKTKSNQKFGTWIKANKVEGTLSGEPCFNVETILGGNQDPLLFIYARQIIENIGETSNKSLLLSISVTDKSKSTFKSILETIFSIKLW